MFSSELRGQKNLYNESEKFKEKFAEGKLKRTALLAKAQARISKASTKASILNAELNAVDKSKDI